MTDDNGHLPGQGRSQTFHNAEAMTNRKRKSKPQTEAVELAGDAAPTKKTKMTLDSNVSAKRPAPRPIPKKSTSSKNQPVPLDRANKAVIPEGFVTPVHPPTNTRNGGTQQEIPAPSLRRTGISILG